MRSSARATLAAPLACDARNRLASGATRRRARAVRRRGGQVSSGGHVPPRDARRPRDDQVAGWGRNRRHTPCRRRSKVLPSRALHPRVRLLVGAGRGAVALHRALARIPLERTRSCSGGDAAHRPAADQACVSFCGQRTQSAGDLLRRSCWRSSWPDDHRGTACSRHCPPHLAPLRIGPRAFADQPRRRPAVDAVLVLAAGWQRISVERRGQRNASGPSYLPLFIG